MSLKGDTLGCCMLQTKRLTLEGGVLYRTMLYIM